MLTSFGGGKTQAGSVLLSAFAEALPDGELHRSVPRYRGAAGGYGAVAGAKQEREILNFDNSFLFIIKLHKYLIHTYLII